MKVKCNITDKCGIVNLGNPKAGEIVNCPVCDKELAYGFYYAPTRSEYWNVIDSEYDEDLGFIPVEII